MALEIKIETVFGVDAMYHRLVEVHYDFRIKTGNAVLACYKDKAARTADKAPLTNYSVALNDVVDLDAENIYTAIKLDKKFADAEDV
ncbi:MAG: hypothetical protein ACK5X3_23265 [Pseudomonadota bacterium]|jgi:hypothetical protein